jgi:hypothetical protein
LADAATHRLRSRALNVVATGLTRAATCRARTSRAGRARCRAIAEGGTGPSAALFAQCAATTAAARRASLSVRARTIRPDARAVGAAAAAVAGVAVAARLSRSAARATGERRAGGLRVRAKVSGAATFAELAARQALTAGAQGIRVACVRSTTCLSGRATRRACVAARDVSARAGRVTPGASGSGRPAAGTAGRGRSSRSTGIAPAGGRSALAGIAARGRFPARPGASVSRAGCGIRAPVGILLRGRRGSRRKL